MQSQSAGVLIESDCFHQCPGDKAFALPAPMSVKCIEPCECSSFGKLGVRSNSDRGLGLFEELQSLSAALVAPRLVAFTATSMELGGW